MMEVKSQAQNGFLDNQFEKQVSLREIQSSKNKSDFRSFKQSLVKGE